MIRVKQATKQGWIECCNGGVADLSYPNSKLRRGRVQGGGTICPTITTTGGCIELKKCCPKIFRNNTMVEKLILEDFYKKRAGGGQGL